MKKKLVVLLATWFKSGLIPPPRFMSGMAGTYGSFFSLPLCYGFLQAVKHLPEGFASWFAWAFIMIVYFVGVIVVPRAERALGPQTDWRGKTRMRDQNQIVIDETFGMLITCLPLAFMQFQSYSWVLTLAFVFFRFFDIVKVPPTRFFDRMHNAAGVMMDDAVAGAYAAVCLVIVVNLFDI